MIDLSIVVPVFNVEEVLPVLLAQFKLIHNTRVEFVLVDDGSTDDSGSILDKFGEEDGRAIIIHTKNGGLSSARNVGLVKSKGKYIWFIDPDDLINLSYFESALHVLEVEDPDLLQFSYREFHKEADLKKDVFASQNKTIAYSWRSSDQLFEALALEDVRSFAWAHIVKKSLYVAGNIEFPVGLNFEDIATTYQLFLRAEKIIVSSNILYYYRLRNGSIMRTADYKSMHDLFEVTKLLLRDRTRLLQEPLGGLFLSSMMQTALNRTFEGKTTSEVLNLRRRIENLITDTRFGLRGKRGLKQSVKKAMMQVHVYDFFQERHLRQ